MAEVKKSVVAKATVDEKKVETKAVAAEAKKEEAKAAPAKKAAAPKKAAAKVVAKETLAVQFAGKDYSSDTIIKLAKDAYKATKNKAAIKTLNVYVNTDDSKAYYVVNDEFKGEVEI